MRKRSGRPQRYAAVPNESIDDSLSLDLMALGLLAVLIRHQDGWVITLEKIGEKYGYGRDAMAKAMGMLMVARYVVKVRMMSTEGNLWSTEVYVFDTPATDAEIAALLKRISGDPDVARAEVIQPTASAVAHAAKRREKLAPGRKRKSPSVAIPRVSENPDSGATCGNDASSQVGPDCGVPRQSGDPTVSKKTVGEKKEREDEGALSARSAGDARRASDRSSHASSSGYAAANSNPPSSTDKTQQPDMPAPRKPAGPDLTAEQLAAVRQVEALLPPVLLSALPYQQFPRHNRPAVLEALGSRTVEQLRERVARRWTSFGYEPAFHCGEITQPIGAALELIAPGRFCPDLACEDGYLIHSGEECRACVQRRADRRQARNAGQPVTSSRKRPKGTGPAGECITCDKPFFGTVPVSGECKPCEEESAAEAMNAFLADFAAEEAAREAEAAAAASEAAQQAEQERLEQEADDRRRAEEKAAQERADAEEMARLRAQIAREHPELAAVSPSAQGTTPPF